MIRARPALRIVASAPETVRQPRPQVPLYYPGETNRCPGCGRTHWIVGRFSVECAFCSAAMMLADGEVL